MSEGDYKPLDPRGLNSTEVYILRELARAHVRIKKWDRVKRRTYIEKFLSILFAHERIVTARLMLNDLHASGYVSITATGRQVYLTEEQFSVAVVKLELWHLMPATEAVLKVGDSVRVNMILEPGDTLPVNYQPGDRRPGEPGRIAQCVGQQDGRRYWLVDHGNDHKIIYSESELTYVPPLPPPQPTHLKVELTGGKKPRLTWVGAAGCTYRIERCRTIGPVPGIGMTNCEVRGTAPGTAFTDKALRAGYLYHYRVIALRDGLESEPSLIVEAHYSKPATQVIPQAAIQLTSTLGPTTTPAQPGPVRRRERRRVVDI